MSITKVTWVMKTEHATNIAKKVRNQKHTNKLIPIEWGGCDWQFYTLVLRNVFEKKKMSDMIDERYDKAKLMTAEGQKAYDQLHLRAKRFIFTIQLRDLASGEWAHDIISAVDSTGGYLQKQYGPYCSRKYRVQQLFHDHWKAKLKKVEAWMRQ